MEIIKRTNILVKTVRRFVVKSQQSNEPVLCGQCSELMVSAQVSADFFGVSSRLIYRLIESGEIHFAETEANKMYVCPSSVRQSLIFFQ